MGFRNNEAQRLYKKEWYKRNRQKVMREVLERKKRLSAALLKLKSQLACSCGESDPVCLDFHHRDPAEKVFDVAAGPNLGSWTRIIEEIAKCDILCANCHRKHHRASLVSAAALLPSKQKGRVQIS